MRKAGSGKHVRYPCVQKRKSGAKRRALQAAAARRNNRAGKCHVTGELGSPSAISPSLISFQETKTADCGCVKSDSEVGSSRFGVDQPGTSFGAGHAVAVKVEPDSSPPSAHILELQHKLEGFADDTKSGRGLGQCTPVPRVSRGTSPFRVATRTRATSPIPAELLKRIVDVEDKVKKDLCEQIVALKGEVIKLKQQNGSLSAKLFSYRYELTASSADPAGGERDEKHWRRRYETTRKQLKAVETEIDRLRKSSEKRLLISLPAQSASTAAP